MRTVIPLVASGISFLAMIWVVIATWRSHSSPWKARIAITLIFVGICSMFISRLLGAKGEELALWQGVYMGCSFSAFLVSVMLPRPPAKSHERENAT